MRPRITINQNKDGELEIWLNEAGRDLLVRELQHLSEQNDHFHLGPEEFDGEVPVQTRPYRKEDKILEWGKVMFRADAWDAQYFPHVFEGQKPSSSYCLLSTQGRHWLLRHRRAPWVHGRCPLRSRQQIGEDDEQESQRRDQRAQHDFIPAREGGH
jgi:hypothetical protein